MVKKLEAMAKGKAERNQLATAIRESAQQIWLAGLGAFSKAQAEGGKAFSGLVKEGTAIQRRTRALTEEKLGEVTGRMTRAAGDIGKQATQSWDKLEQVFEDRVSRALTRLGVPTSKEIQELIARVDALNDSVQAMSGTAPAARRRAAPTRGATAVKATVPAKKATRRRSAKATA